MKFNMVKFYIFFLKKIFCAKQAIALPLFNLTSDTNTQVLSIISRSYQVK